MVTADALAIAFVAAALSIPSFASAANKAPVISGTPSNSVAAETRYVFKPTASDPDGDSLRFSVVNRPVWASFSSKTGRLSGTPGENHVGEYTDIRVRVSDGSRRVSLPAFAIKVTSAAEPSPPPPPPSGGTLAKLLNFAETWDRNWNFGGHSVTSAFNESYGRWDYSESTYEPWLFDRATVGYRLYELTGDPRWSDQFLTDFAWYRQRIDSQGIFKPKGGGDTKYSYVTPFALYEKLTGDQQYRPIAKRIYDAWVREWPANYNPGTSFWTEREMGFALEAAVSWYEMTSDPAALSRATALVNQWTAISGSQGVPLHTLAQHGEEYEAPYASMKMTSTWMSALYFQAARRFYAISNSAQVLEQVSKYADFVDRYGIVDGSAFSSGFAGVKVPYYLFGVGTYYDRETPSEADMAHCLDAAGIFNFAIFAKRQRGEAVTAAQTRYNQMLACADRDFQEWTRSTTWLPKYRLTPPRKFNWQLRGYFEAAQ
jgi:hypothetical protein